MKEITPRQPAGTLAANLDQLIESFLLAQDVGITSKIVYRRALKRFKEFLSLREAAGGVGYLTKTDIVQYKSHLLAEGLSPRTGNLYLTSCLLYTSDAADDLLCVDLGGRRIIKKKKKNTRRLY